MTLVTNLANVESSDNLQKYLDCGKFYEFTLLLTSFLDNGCDTNLLAALDCSKKSKKFNYTILCYLAQHKQWRLFQLLYGYFPEQAVFYCKDISCSALILMLNIAFAEIAVLNYNAEMISTISAVTGRLNKDFFDRVKQNKLRRYICKAPAALMSCLRDLLCKCDENKLLPKVFLSDHYIFFDQFMPDCKLVGVSSAALAKPCGNNIGVNGYRIKPTSYNPNFTKSLYLKLGSHWLIPAGAVVTNPAKFKKPDSRKVFVI